MSSKIVSGPVRKRIEEAISMIVEQEDDFPVDMGDTPEFMQNSQVLRDPMAAYFTAKHQIRGRWPDMEDLIMQDPMAACRYAEDVIRDRWPEAEPYIMQDPMWWDRYTRIFGIEDD